MKQMTSADLYGNWATLLLATDDRGNLDYSRLADEIDALIASGPDGIYSNGTACEFYSQDMEEFVRIGEMLDSKCRAASVPYQIGVSHPCAQESLKRLQSIRHLRPSAVQVILPDWFPVNDEAVFSFLEVMTEEACGIPVVLYNPPHAKRVLPPSMWTEIKSRIPSFIGVKVYDDNCSAQWYAQMRENNKGISVFVPGHHLATGYMNGASGAYSNVACLNPSAAQNWYNLMTVDIDGALELEGRIRRFMEKCIDPFITKGHFPNHACDRFMALVGNWADVGSRLRWPYSSIPVMYVEDVRKVAHDIIPEFI